MNFRRGRLVLRFCGRIVVTLLMRLCRFCVRRRLITCAVARLLSVVWVLTLLCLVRLSVVRLTLTIDRLVLVMSLMFRLVLTCAV